MPTTFILAHDIAKQRTVEAVRAAEHHGWMVTLSEPKQSDLQRERYHAMIGDIAKHEPKFDALVWKRLLIDQFQSETNNDQFPRLRDYWRREQIRMLPSLDGQRVITLGEQSRVFPRYVSAAFIDWLLAWGAVNEIRFKDPEALDDPDEFSRFG